MKVVGSPRPGGFVPKFVVEWESGNSVEQHPDRVRSLVPHGIWMLRDEEIHRELVAATTRIAETGSPVR